MRRSARFLATYGVRFSGLRSRRAACGAASGGTTRVRLANRVVRAPPPLLLVPQTTRHVPPTRPCRTFLDALLRHPPVFEPGFDLLPSHGVGFAVAELGHGAGDHRGVFGGAWNVGGAVVFVFAAFCFFVRTTRKRFFQKTSERIIHVTNLVIRTILVSAQVKVFGSTGKRDPPPGPPVIAKEKCQSRMGKQCVRI